jgi:hypothetical protein
MLNNSLNTNEVKNSAGTSVNFTRLAVSDRATVFAKTSEAPSLPHRLAISHTEIGTGFKKRRRSVVRVDITTLSTVDSVTPVTTSAYIVLDAPVGALSTTATLSDSVAELTSFVATLASSTFVYDGSGNGAAALIQGSL